MQELTLIQNGEYLGLALINVEDIPKIKNREKPVLVVKGTSNIIVEYQYDDSQEVTVIRFNDIDVMNEKSTGKDYVDIILLDDDSE